MLVRHAELLRRLCPERTFTALREQPHFDWGGDNDVYLADESLIFLFPRTEEASRALAIEAALLPALAERSALPIPRFSGLVRDESGGQPRGVCYEAIPGQPLRGADVARLAAVAPAAVAQMADQLGRFLAALHGFPVEQALACGLGVYPWSLREQAERHRLRLERELCPSLAADERDWLARRFAGYLADARHYALPRCPCHGDLTSDHIYFDPARQALTGVIDFGDIWIGDRAGDFVWRYEYGEAFYRQAYASYAAELALPLGDPAAFDAAVAFRYDLMPTNELAYGLEIGNSAYVEEGRRELRARMQVRR